MGYHGAAGAVGVGLSPFASDWIGSHFGWRMSCIRLSIPGLMLVLLMLFWRFEERESESGLSSDEALPRVKTLILPLSLLYVAYVFSGLCYRGTMTFFRTSFADAMDPNLLDLGGLEIGGLLTTIPLLPGRMGL